MDIEKVDVEFRRAVASRLDEHIGVEGSGGGPMMAGAPSAPSTQVVLQYLPIVLQAILDVINKLKQGT